MDTSKLIITVLTSSFLGAGLTSFINFIIQRNNYRDDFYKKVLDKRLLAYENLMPLIKELQIFVHTDKSELCPTFMTKKDHFYTVFIQLGVGGFESIWLSPEMGMKISNLNIFLLENVLYKIPPTDALTNYERKLERKGVELRDSLRDIRVDLQTQFKKDFSEIPNVKLFLKSKNLSQPYLLQSNPYPTQN